jgi:nicotinamidase-related amidase
MKNALIVIDFINEIVDLKGKLVGKGYGAFIEKASTFEHLNKAIGIFRENESPVIFVRLGFDQAYTNQPKLSPVFGKANEFGILKTNDWSTQFHASVSYQDSDITIQKSRVSAFYDTPLASMLRNIGVTHVFIAGVATDLAVEAAARDAHDRDFIVTVVSDACAAATIEDHEKSLRFFPKIGSVVTADEIKL